MNYSVARKYDGQINPLIKKLYDQIVEILASIKGEETPFVLLTILGNLNILFADSAAKIMKLPEDKPERHFEIMSLFMEELSDVNKQFVEIFKQQQGK